MVLLPFAVHYLISEHDWILACDTDTAKHCDCRGLAEIAL